MYVVTTLVVSVAERLKSPLRERDRAAVGGVPGANGARPSWRVRRAYDACTTNRWELPAGATLAAASPGQRRVTRCPALDGRDAGTPCHRHAARPGWPQPDAGERGRRAIRHGNNL